jgi:hypothetical protein
MDTKTIERIKTKGFRATRIAAALLALAAGTGASIPEGENPQVEALTIPAEVLAAEDHAIASTKEGYEAAGFEFPVVDIRFHTDLAACEGYSGHYVWFAGQTPTADICYDRLDLEGGHIGRARILWHEIAHAYLEPRVDDATRAALLDLVGYEEWSTGDWGERGGEYAAEIFLWGMKDGRYQEHPVLAEVDCEVKAAGFTMLTGRVAPTC